ncbi:HAUS6 protein, partial [Baryphthengus martii]|nr:HAUS6 protein [Baryphthengus martii]
LLFCVYRMKQNDQNKNDKTEAIKKVRSMWTFIMEMLTSLKKEKEDVDSVLDEHKCILDGTNVVFRIPQLLVHRVGSDTHQLCTGNVYEAEKLNFLTVIQLLNEALRTLRDEHCQSEFKLQVVENTISHYDEALKDVTAKRLVMLQQLCVPTSVSNWRKQEDWEVKWKNFLDQCPFNLCLEQNSVSSV